ncbi:glycosyltransferase family 4 protein [Sphaerobacter sp.]|uniref:glycosyltransferase family 4 protein n=1 Tax=Sphaerobacter sp. TaxID=2099654 RepID=UPI001DF43ACB|nr:glycosyltransferase family 4 protein [Sphaerobacter sp.]MBX5445315.1 glycosyltransferase family 4 protein [Sphaerobacter sp.]
MHILVVHNRYQQAGGEDVVFAAEVDLLRRYGHTVTELVFDNREIPERPAPIDAARLALGTVWSRKGAARVRAAIREHRPEVVHFHNTFPLVSPAAYYAARAERVAVVQTLHNYRLICPGSLLYRDDHICHDCVGRVVPWPGVVHGCYRESRAQTAPVAAMLAVHRLAGTWRNLVDRYIALSQVARDQFVAGGLPEERIVVKPNFVDLDPPDRSSPGEFYLFAGRLAVEKGVDTLLRAWTEHGRPEPLHIVGDGPLARQVEAAAQASPSIRSLGRLDRTAVLEQMRQARALIFPSVWYEGFPMILVEALASGLPVIASRLGAAAEVIEDGVTGLHVTAGSAADLAAKVDWLSRHPDAGEEMGRAARRVYEAKYTSAQNYEQLMAIYEAACARSRRTHA